MDARYEASLESEDDLSSIESESIEDSAFVSTDDWNDRHNLSVCRLMHSLINCDMRNEPRMIITIKA